jgi:5-formyltetrahydrofolate cyclo-ligase
MAPAESKIEIRQRLRQCRRELSADAREKAAEAVATRLAHTRLFHQSRDIAYYLPADGELDTAAIAEHLHHSHKHGYLPVLSRIGHDRLWFALAKTDARFGENRYGILEPRVPARELVRAQALDLILLPLVGFDTRGHRLGMGGGYYDRSLAFLRARQHWRRPRLIGLAFECQKLAAVPHDDWDVPLDAIVTETALYGEI